MDIFLCFEVKALRFLLCVRSIGSWRQGETSPWGSPLVNRLSMGNVAGDSICNRFLLLQVSCARSNIIRLHASMTVDDSSDNIYCLIEMMDAIVMIWSYGIGTFRRDAPQRGRSPSYGIVHSAQCIICQVILLRVRHISSCLLLQVRETPACTRGAMLKMRHEMRAWRSAIETMLRMHNGGAIEVCRRTHSSAAEKVCYALAITLSVRFWKRDRHLFMACEVWPSSSVT